MVALNSINQSTFSRETSFRVENALIRSNPDRFISVSAYVFCGIVELSGSVANINDKLLAMQIAERIPGVTTVVESLKIDKQFHLSPHLRPKLQRRAYQIENTSSRTDWNDD